MGYGVQYSVCRSPVLENSSLCDLSTKNSRINKRKNDRGVCSNWFVHYLVSDGEWVCRIENTDNIKTSCLKAVKNKKCSKGVVFMDKVEWLLCPVCKNKTRIKLRQDTTLLNFLLFCPKCKEENLIDVKQHNITVIKEPDAKTLFGFTYSLHCTFNDN